MKKFITFIFACMVLLFTVTPTSAEEIDSPPLVFKTTKSENGEIVVTLNWENQTMRMFDYAVVYDDTKVRVKSVRFKGDFLSKYSGDTNDYGGMAIANDNGGYVVLGGIFEVKEGAVAPTYNGVIATIVFVPKDAQVTTEEPKDSDDIATTEPTDEPQESEDTEDTEDSKEEESSEQYGDFDAGEVQLVEGASSYANSQEILDAAASNPNVSFNVNTAVGAEPVKEDTSSQTADSNGVTSQTATDSTSGDVTGSTSSGTEGIGTQIVEDATGTTIENTDTTEDSKTAAILEPKKNQSNEWVFSPMWIFVPCVCAIGIAVAVLVYKKIRNNR